MNDAQEMDVVSADSMKKTSLGVPGKIKTQPLGLRGFLCNF